MVSIVIRPWSQPTGHTGLEKSSLFIRSRRLSNFGGDHRGKLPGEITGGKSPGEITGGVHLDPYCNVKLQCLWTWNCQWSVDGANLMHSAG